VRKYFWALTILSAILLFAPLRTGDLAGYDDAQYAHIAKAIVRSGDWLTLHSNGYPAMENTPLLEWMQAALFSVFGFSDALARLPSALCGFGTILLVGWLARRLTGNALTAALAMLVMATSIYFLKYAARAMTDVPFTFFFLCAVCAWSLTADDARWYLATGVATALALMTRSMMGLALPVVFALDLAASRRRPVWRYAIPSLAFALVPVAVFYANMIHQYGGWFFDVHSTWLRNEVYGSLSPSWRRFTGPFEYVWMLVKSYWPWLPVMIAGAVVVIRGQDRRLWLLVWWVAMVFALCSVTRSRVLRYMLPAYPAFSILSALGLMKLVPAHRLRSGLRIATPVLGLLALGVAAFPRTHWEAAEIRPIALAATAATSAGERVAFYDSGQTRYDELNQMQWYGDRYLNWLGDRGKLLAELRSGVARVCVLDRTTYNAWVASSIAHQVLAESGHLVCIRTNAPVFDKSAYRNSVQCVERKEDGH
jgi:4-amino-4-deoxy-L-arabinose transferase-like glycosyltransferase